MDPPVSKKHAAKPQKGEQTPTPIPAPLFLSPSPTASITSESSTSAVSLQRLINSRKNEIILFKNQVIKSSGGTGGGLGHHKRAHQLLPRHMRRRAMSYNPRLIPFRLRDLAMKQSEETKAPKKRSYFIRRRRPFELQNIEGRKWLNTHMWHAKRFKMECYGGYKIPWHNANRSSRPSAQSMKTNAVIMDASYINPISLIGERNDLCSLFDSMRINWKQKQLFSDFGLYRLQSVLIYNPPQNSNRKFDLISPALIHGRTIQQGQAKEATLKFQFLIWLDPNAYHALDFISSIDEFKNIEITYPKDSFNRFEIIGPQAGQVLKRILFPTSQQDAHDLAKYLENRPSCTPPGTTLVFEVRDPRMAKFMNPKMKSSEAPKTTSSSNNNFISMLSSLVLYPQEKNTKSISSTYRINSCALFDFPHQHFQSKFKDHETHNPDSIAKIIDQNTTYVMLQRFEESGDEREGWIMYTTSSFGLIFWKQLAHCGVRSIGLVERNAQKLQTLHPRMPQDFPGTEAYQMWVKDFAELLEVQWKNKPPQKRVNFNKTGIVSPFKPNWNAIQTQDFDRITYSFGLDPTSIPASADNKELVLVPVSLHLEFGGTTPQYNAHLYEIQSVEPPSKQEAAPIGFVTGGGFSLDSGMCTAIAFIELNACKRNWTHKKESLRYKVWLRNVSSTQYHVATVCLLKSFY